MCLVRLDGIDACLLHGRRSVKVGFAQGKGDDIDALGLQFAGFSGHGNRGRFAQTLEQLRGGGLHEESWNEC